MAEPLSRPTPDRDPKQGTSTTVVGASPDIAPSPMTYRQNFTAPCGHAPHTRVYRAFFNEPRTEVPSRAVRRGSSQHNHHNRSDLEVLYLFFVGRFFSGHRAVTVELPVGSPVVHCL